MDSVWKNLIIISILILVFSVIWEFYSIFDGYRNTQTTFVVDMPRDKVIEDDLRLYIQNINL
jgi:capsular polysaccharide biosynthesis protein